jgi:hypothetical protein
MDRTSVEVSKTTRNDLRAFKNAEGHPNYNVAVRELLADRED